MPIPPKPPALQVTSVTHQSLDLSWESLHAKLTPVLSQEDGKLKVEVQVSRSSNSSSSIGGGGGADQAASGETWDVAYKGFDTRCSVTGLADSQVYSVRFRFGVAAGWGAFSEPQSVRTSRRPFTGEDLHRLVRLEKQQELQRVLASGEAGVDAPDDKGFSPLMQAALAGGVAFCDLLLDHGAQVDWCTENGKTALMLVSYRGILPSLRLLLDRGADVSRRDRKGATALHYAVDGEKLEAMALLMAACGTDGGQQQLLLHARDASGSSAIVRCAMLKNNGNPDVARALLAAGARLDDADDQAQTALFYCALHRHLRMAELLVEAGADPARANDKGLAPAAVADAQESSAMRLLFKRSGGVRSGPPGQPHQPQAAAPPPQQ